MPLNKFTKLLLILILFLIFCSDRSAAQVDSTAVAILDKMSDVLCNLSSCSLKLKTEYDIYDEQLGLIKNSDQADIFLKAPDKVFIKREGDRGKRNIYYDGKNLTYYSLDNNNYASAPAPPSIMEMIDEFHDKYGIDFPAADVFEADLTDNLLEISARIVYLGPTTVNDKSCFHIAGVTDSLSYQIWIADDGTFLP